MNNTSTSSSEGSCATKSDKRKSRRRSSVLVKKFSCAGEDAMGKDEEEPEKSENKIPFEEYYQQLLKEKEVWNSERSRRRQRKREVFRDASRLTQADWESIQEHLTEEEKAFQAARPDYEKIIESFEKLKKKIEIHKNIKKKASHAMINLVERCEEEIDTVKDNVREFNTM